MAKRFQTPCFHDLHVKTSVSMHPELVCQRSRPRKLGCLVVGNVNLPHQKSPFRQWRPIRGAS
jgi:hypothetical protein